MLSLHLPHLRYCWELSCYYGQGIGSPVLSLSLSLLAGKAYTLLSLLENELLGESGTDSMTTPMGPDRSFWEVRQLTRVPFWWEGSSINTSTGPKWASNRTLHYNRYVPKPSSISITVLVLLSWFTWGLFWWSNTYFCLLGPFFSLQGTVHNGTADSKLTPLSLCQDKVDNLSLCILK